jgi:hypothetical protein
MPSDPRTVTEIVYFGRPARVECDGMCEKAWGISSRPSISLSDDPDDVVYLADGELGDAPSDPGTYEGGHGKPFHPLRHNKWCVRQCERSAISRPDESKRPHDFRRRLFNLRHRGDAEAVKEA